MEKYIRTKSGDIWELGSDGNYHKPSAANIISPDSDAIVAKSDELWRLVREGDLIIFFLKGHGHIVVEKTDASRLPQWNIKEIYTQYEPLSDYRLQAYCSSSVWHVK